MTPFSTTADLAVVRVTGDDRQSYLDDVTTQRLADADPGDVVGTLHLDPHGSVLAVMDVVVHPDHLMLLVPRELTGHVIEVLGGRTFLLDATFEEVDQEVVSVDVTDHLERLTAAGVEPADQTALEDWRIRAGIARWGREIVSGHLPEELGLLPTHVHLDKGCYPGQEAVARMWMLGRPRRRLAVVDVRGGAEPGWEAGEGRQRVTLTSITSDGATGLAFVPPDTDEGGAFTEGDVTVVVERVVGDTLDVPGHDPSVTRRRDRRGAGSTAQ